MFFNFSQSWTPYLMQTFYGTFLIIAYDPTPPSPLTIVPYIHEPRFAPGSFISVTCAQLKLNPVVKFSNPNIGPKCELYSYVDRDKWVFFCFVLCLNSSWISFTSLGLTAVSTTTGHTGRSGCVLSSTIFYSVLCIFTVIWTSGWYK